MQHWAVRQPGDRAGDPEGPEVGQGPGQRPGPVVSSICRCGDTGRPVGRTADGQPGPQGRDSQGRQQRSASPTG